MNLRINTLASIACAAALVLFGCRAGRASAQLVTHTPTPAPYGSSVGAHARFSKARINLGPPDYALTSAVIAAGGGPADFDAQKLIGALTGNGALTQSEMASLTKRFGVDDVASFVRTFDYAITDSLAQATAAGIELPPTPMPDPGDGKALSAALYAAGVAPHGGYDVEYMLDALMTHVIHVAVMNDIDANPELGPRADANYHAVLGQTMQDLKATYKL
jgi:hypothetical protein